MPGEPLSRKTVRHTAVLGFEQCLLTLYVERVMGVEPRQSCVFRNFAECGTGETHEM